MVRALVHTAYFHRVRIISNHVATYFADLYPLAHQSLLVSIHALKLYFKLIITALHPLFTLSLYLYDVLSPIIGALLRSFLIALTLQPRHIVAIELGIIVFIVTALFLERRYGFIHRMYSVYSHTRRRIVQRYSRLQRLVNTKSQIAASALPHVIFAVTASLFHASLAQFLIPFVRGPGLVFIACVRPAYRTLCLLYAMDVTPLSNRPSSPTSSLSLIDTSGTFISPSPTRALSFTPIEKTTVSAESSEPASSNVVRATSSNVVRQLDVSTESIRYRKRSNFGASSETPKTEHSRALITSSLDNSEKFGETMDSQSQIPLSASSRRVRIDETPRRTNQKSDSKSISPEPRSRLRRVSDLFSMSGVRSFGRPDSSTPFRNKPKESSTTTDKDTNLKKECNLLAFWVVFGMLWGLRSLTWFFCPKVFESFMMMVDTWLFYIFVWAQSSLTTGAQLGYDLFRSFLREKGFVSRSGQKFGSQYSNKFSDAAATNETVMQLGVVMRMLSSLRVVNVIKSGRIWRFLTDSGAVTGIAILFLAVPRIVTFVCTLLVGILFPAINTAIVLEKSNEVQVGRNFKKDAEVSDSVGIDMRRHNWLAYWSVFSLLDATYASGAEAFGWLPLWYHVKMGIILWLLIPRFRGTTMVLDWFMSHIGALLSTVKKQTVTPRKRKRG